MFRRSGLRLATTLLVLFSLLFSQLALASYACPGFASKIAAMPDMPGAQMPSGEPCEMGMASGGAVGQDPEQPVLCHQHCSDAPQSPDKGEVPSLGMPAVVQVLVVPPVLDASVSASFAFAQAVRERPPPEPLFLSTLRLRV